MQGGGLTSVRRRTPYIYNHADEYIGLDNSIAPLLPDMRPVYQQLRNFRDYIGSDDFIRRASKFRDPGLGAIESASRMGNLADIENNIIVRDSLSKDNRILGRASYWSSDGESLIPPSIELTPQAVNSTVPTHEFAHISTAGNRGLNRWERDYIKERIDVESLPYDKDFNESIGKSTEVHARINDVRQLALDLGIHKEFGENFTLEQLADLEDQYIRRGYDKRDTYTGVETFLQMIKDGQSGIDLLNNIAAVNNGQSAKGIAKKGGRYQDGGLAALPTLPIEPLPVEPLPQTKKLTPEQIEAWKPILKKWVADNYGGDVGQAKRSLERGEVGDSPFNKAALDVIDGGLSPRVIESPTDVLPSKVLSTGLDALGRTLGIGNSLAAEAYNLATGKDASLGRALNVFSPDQQTLGDAAGVTNPLGNALLSFVDPIPILAGARLGRSATRAIRGLSSEYDKLPALVRNTKRNLADQRKALSIYRDALKNPDNFNILRREAIPSEEWLKQWYSDPNILPRLHRYYSKDALDKASVSLLARRNKLVDYADRYAGLDAAARQGSFPSSLLRDGYISEDMISSLPERIQKGILKNIDRNRIDFKKLNSADYPSGLLGVYDPSYNIRSVDKRHFWPFNEKGLQSLITHERTHGDVQAIETFDAILRRMLNKNFGLTRGKQIAKEYNLNEMIPDYVRADKELMSGRNKDLIFRYITGNEYTPRMGGNAAFTKQEVDDLVRPFRQNSGSITRDDYVLKPQEIHSRMNEIRQDLNLTPKDRFTFDMLREYIKTNRRRLKTPRTGFSNMARMLTYNKAEGLQNEFVDLMNRFYTVPPATAIGLSLGSNDRGERLR